MDFEHLVTAIAVILTMFELLGNDNVCSPDHAKCLDVSDKGNVYHDGMVITIIGIVLWVLAQSVVQGTVSVILTVMGIMAKFSTALIMDAYVIKAVEIVKCDTVRWWHKRSENVS